MVFRVNGQPVFVKGANWIATARPSLVSQASCLKPRNRASAYAARTRLTQTKVSRASRDRRGKST